MSDTEDTLDAMLRRVINDMPEYASLMCADASDDPYAVPMEKLAALLLVYHACKDAGYGRSWARRGESGVYHNVMRKSDRYDKLAENMRVLDKSARVVMSGHEVVDESLRIAFIDLLVDIPLYCLMWLDWIITERPEDFHAWLDKVWSTVTGVDAEHAKAFL